MSDLPVILAVALLLIAFVLLCYFANFLHEMWEHFWQGFHKSRRGREVLDEAATSIPVDRVTAPSIGIPIVYDAEGNRITVRRVSDTMPVNPDTSDSVDEEIAHLHRRIGALTRQNERLSSILKGSLSIQISTNSPPKNVPNVFAGSYGLVWVKVPRPGERSAEVYDFNFQAMSFENVGDDKYGKVTQVVTNVDDNTIARIQTLTAEGIGDIVDDIDGLPPDDMRSDCLPDHVRDFMGRLPADDRQLFISMMGIDRNDPIRDGMAAASRSQRKIDISD